MNDFEKYMEREFEHLYRAYQKFLTEGDKSLSDGEIESAWAYTLMEQAWAASRWAIKSNYRRAVDWLKSFGKAPSPEDHNEGVNEI